MTDIIDATDRVHPFDIPTHTKSTHHFTYPHDHVLSRISTPPLIFIITIHTYFTNINPTFTNTYSLLISPTFLPPTSIPPTSSPWSCPPLALYLPPLPPPPGPVPLVHE